MNDYRAYVYNDYNSIYHTGILGMKWGRRRWQNEDGTLTPEGKIRYAKMKKKWMENSRDFEKHYEQLTPAEREKAQKRMEEIARFRRNEAVQGKKGIKIGDVLKTGGAIGTSTIAILKLLGYDIKGILQKK